MCKFQEAVREGKLIPAVKELRTLTGLGLKEAVDMIRTLPQFKVPVDTNAGGEHIVVRKYNDGGDPSVSWAYSRAEANEYASEMIHNSDVTIARVVAFTKRTLVDC